MAKRTSRPETDEATAHITPDLRPLAQLVSALVPDPRNARRHDDRNVTAVVDSLRRFGQKKPIVGRLMPDGSVVVVAGNGTLEAAKRLGLTMLAVTVSEMDDRTAQAYAIADNRTAELAEWDEAVLADVLRELAEAPGGLEDVALGAAFDEADLESLGLLEAVEAPAVQVDEDPSVETQADVSAGAVIRQILVLLSPEDYDTAQAAIEKLKAAHGLTTTAEVFMWLVRTAGV